MIISWKKNPKCGLRELKVIYIFPHKALDVNVNLNKSCPIRYLTAYGFHAYV